MQLYADGGYESIEERFNRNIGIRRYASGVKSYFPSMVIQKLKRIRDTIKRWNEKIQR